MRFYYFFEQNLGDSSDKLDELPIDYIGSIGKFRVISSGIFFDLNGWMPLFSS